jgi:hypothetical protein
MELKITYSKSRQKATALADILVAMGVGSILMVAVGSLSLFTGRSLAALTNYADLDSASRTALDIITRDIRQTTSLYEYSSNSLTFVDYDNGMLKFVYSPGAKTLTRIKGNETKVLLKECDYFQFTLWQRNPVPGTFDLVATTNADLCKAVNLTWVCSRKILGQPVNTESVQTARIILRKQRNTTFGL